MNFITHPMGSLTVDPTPDLPLLFAGSPKVGLRLYSIIPGFLIGFILLFTPGLLLNVLNVRKKLRDWKGENDPEIPRN